MSGSKGLVFKLAEIPGESLVSCELQLDNSGGT